MFRLNSTTDFYKEFVTDLYLLLVEHRLGEICLREDDSIYFKPDLPKLDFDQIVRTKFDSSEKKFEVIINDGLFRYGFFTCDIFGDYGDRVSEIFLGKLNKREKYIRGVIDDFPSIVFSIDEDNISGELREELLKLEI